MDDGMFVKIFVAIDELAHDDYSFVFGELFSFLKDIFERASIAELLEQINVVRGLFDIIQFHNVFIFDGLHDLDFVLERFVEFLWIFFYVAGGYSFHGHQLACSNIGTLEHLTVGAAPDLVVDVDDEGLNELIVGGAQLGRFLLDFLHLSLVHYLQEFF